MTNDTTSLCFATEAGAFFLVADDTIVVSRHFFASALKGARGPAAKELWIED